MTAAVWVKAKVRRGPARVGVRGGTQLIEYKNKALLLVPRSLLPLRYGGFYMQPGGLVPRARGRIYRLPPLPPTSRAAPEITPSASWAVALHSCAGGSINLRAKAGAGGLELCSLWHPMADNLGPYKKISDQICSIPPWLPEAGVARVPK